MTSKNENFCSENEEDLDTIIVYKYFLLVQYQYSYENLLDIAVENDLHLAHGSTLAAGEVLAALSKGIELIMSQVNR